MSEQRVRLRSCERCGAVVAMAAGEGGVDNEQPHQGWHEAQDRLLEALARHARAPLRARLAGWLGRQR